MKRVIVLTVLLLAGVAHSRAAAGADFDEIYELLRKNLTGVSDAELEQAATKGLIQQLYPLVSLATNAAPLTNVQPLAVTSVFEGAYGYFRFGSIVEGADKEFSAGLKRLASTNRLKGLVLDLRFASGQDYEAAAALADLFLPPRQPMADWGDGMKMSTAKTNAVNLPLALLINSQTSGSAEAFAAILRRSEIGLLLGDHSAGLASISREFALKNGQKVRIATTPVKIASGGPIDRQGLNPDVKVEVAAAEERAFLQDAYRPLKGADRFVGVNGGTNTTAAAGTNRSRRRINEAELVRMQREGVDLEAEFSTGRESGPVRPPTVTDPVLARAIDILKGLSVVQQFRGF
jgi:hypothetical protein